jgi:hypothetical protein
MIEALEVSENLLRLGCLAQFVVIVEDKPLDLRRPQVFAEHQG